MAITKGVGGHTFRVQTMSLPVIECFKRIYKKELYLNKQNSKCVSKTHIDKRRGAVKTVCNIPANF